MIDRLLCIGKITSAHGVKGAVKIKSYTVIPESIGDYSPVINENASRQFDVQIISVKDDMLIANIAGVDNRNDAEALAGIELFTRRSNFPGLDDDEFYHEDLIGMTVVDADGQNYGILAGINNYGGGDIVEVALSDGKIEMFAFNLETFPDINMESGCVTICPPEVEYAGDNDNDVK